MSSDKSEDEQTTQSDLESLDVSSDENKSSDQETRSQAITSGQSDTARHALRQHNFVKTGYNTTTIKLCHQSAKPLQNKTIC